MSKKGAIRIKMFPKRKPGFWFVEYDPRLVSPDHLLMAKEEIDRLKAEGWYGGAVFRKGAVSFATWSEGDLAKVGLKQIGAVPAVDLDPPCAEDFMKGQQNGAV